MSQRTIWFEQRSMRTPGRESLSLLLSALAALGQTPSESRVANTAPPTWPIRSNSCKSSRHQGRNGM